MPLLERLIDTTAVPAPNGEIAAFLAEADRRIRHFLDNCHRVKAARYIPSDPHAVYAGLVTILVHRLASGHRFCEWGSGFGVATCLAAMLGYDAVGIELDATLHLQSKKLAQDFGLHCELVCGDFVPSRFEYFSDDKGCADGLVQSSLLPSQEQFRDTYFDDPYPVEDFDLIFAYPWPDETAMLVDIFETCAEEGMLLMTYCATNGIRVFEKQ